MRISVIASLLLASAIVAPASAATPETSPESAGDIAATRAKFARIVMKPDTSYLTAEERKVVNLLIKAADLMDEIYLRQAYAKNPKVRSAIQRMRRADQPQILDMFDLMAGPWDRLDENRPFWGTAPWPPGAGHYPEDMTKA